MKNRLKILLLFCLVIVIVSCNKQDAKQKDIDNENTIEQNGLVEITSSSHFLSENSNQNGYDYTDDKTDWYMKIEEEFDINLVIHDVHDYDLSFLYQPNGYLAIKEYIESGEIGGLLAIPTDELLYSLIINNLIVPLDEYVYTNENWLIAPDEWKNAYKIGGETWAFPKSFSNEVFCRFIRADWLEALNLKEPASIPELYDIMHHFTYNDPDNDNINNTSGAWFWFTKGLEDIFALFDARLSYDGKFQPAWNPNTEKWENSFLKPEMQECLLFIKQCYDEGVLVDTIPVADEYLNYNDFQQGYSGSYAWQTRNGKILIEQTIQKFRPAESPEIKVLDNLLGNISTNINGYYKSYRTPYVLLKNSINPKETINNFVNSFLSDYDGYLMGRFGLPGVAFNEENSIINLVSIEKEGQFSPYSGPGLVVSSPFVNCEIKSYNFGMEYIEKDNEFLGLAVSNEMFYLVPESIIKNSNNRSWSSKLQSLNDATTSIFHNILNGTVSIDAGIEEYKKLSQSMGMDDYIEFQNELLGNQ